MLSSKMDKLKIEEVKENPKSTTKKAKRLTEEGK